MILCRGHHEKVSMQSPDYLNQPVSVSRLCAYDCLQKYFPSASSSSTESSSSSQGGIKQKETSQSAPVDKQVAIVDDMDDLYTGVLHDYKGGTYSGVLLDGKPHGQGTWTHSNAEYVGEWKNGTIHGQGIFTSYAG